MEIQRRRSIRSYFDPMVEIYRVYMNIIFTCYNHISNKLIKTQCHTIIADTVMATVADEVMGTVGYGGRQGRRKDRGYGRGHRLGQDRSHHRHQPRGFGFWPLTANNSKRSITFWH